MKTILLPTDFSKTATNAIDYAFYLFKNENIEYILYHSYLIPNSGATMFSSLDTLYLTEAMSRLKKEKIRIKELYGVDVIIISNQNILYSGIKDIVKEHKVNQIVMGTTGATGLESVIFGSNTVDVIDKIDIPLIIVPKGVKFKSLKNVLFCSDYEKVDYQKTLSFIKEIVVDKKAKLKILHVKTHQEETPKKDHIDESVKEREYFQPELDVEFKLVLAKDVEGGINWYLSNKSGADLLVMINHKRGFFEKMFAANRTYNFAYSTKIPMLVLQG